LRKLSPTSWTGIWKSTSVRPTVAPSLREDEALEEDRGRRRRWLHRLRRDRRSRRVSPLVLPSGPPSSPPPPSVTTRFPDRPIPALGDASLPGVRPAVSVSTAPAMSARSSSRRDSRKDSTAGEDATSRGTPLASRRPGLAGVGVHSCLPLEVPVPATAGLGISVLTVVVTRDEPPGPATSAGVGGGGTKPEDPGIPAPAGAGGVSVDVRRGDASPGEDIGVGIVVSGAHQPGEPGDTYDQERRGGNEAQGGNPDTSREIVIPSGQGHAHESSPVTRERSPVTRVPAPDVSQKIPCCSTNLSHKTPCHPSLQKQIGTPARRREPTRTPFLYSRPVTRSPRKTPEGAKRKEEGENAVILFVGKPGHGRPAVPFS